MKIDHLLIPGKLSPLFAELYKFKKEVNGENEEVSFYIPESWIISLFKEFGAIQGNQTGFQEAKNVKNETKQVLAVTATDNQTFTGVLPQELVEIMKTHQVNVVRAIMIAKDLSLKEVAAAYGGSSAQANVSNFLSRTEDELKSMRRSTVIRLAQAMAYPAEQMLNFLSKN